MRPFALLILCLLASAPALPCSFPLPNLLGAHEPAVGVGAVPLNTRLVFFTPPFPSDVPVQLAREEDEPRAVPARTNGELFVVTPDEELEPDTRYTVSFGVQSDDFVELPEPFSFTTGSERDTAAPVLEGAPEAEVEHRAAAPFGSVDSCGGGLEDTWTVSVALPSVSDDVAVAGLRLLRIDELTGGRVEVAAGPLGTESLHDRRHEQGSFRYVLEAFDLAGNAVESEAFEVSLLPFGCSSAQLPSTTPLGGLAALLGLCLFALRRRVTR